MRWRYAGLFIGFLFLFVFYYFTLFDSLGFFGYLLARVTRSCVDAGIGMLSYGAREVGMAVGFSL